MINKAYKGFIFSDYLSLEDRIEVIELLLFVKDMILIEEDKSVEQNEVKENKNGLSKTSAEQHIKQEKENTQRKIVDDTIDGLKDCLLYTSDAADE